MAQTPSKGVTGVYLQTSHSNQGPGRLWPEEPRQIPIGPSPHQHQGCSQPGPCQRDQDSGSMEGVGPSPFQVSEVTCCGLHARGRNWPPSWNVDIGKHEERLILDGRPQNRSPSSGLGHGVTADLSGVWAWSWCPRPWLPITQGAPPVFW